MIKKLIKAIFGDAICYLIISAIIIIPAIALGFFIDYADNQFRESNMLFVIPLNIIEFVFFVLPLSCILIYFPLSWFDNHRAFLDIYGNYDVLGFYLTFFLSAYLIVKISLRLYREFCLYVERKKLELSQ